MFEVYAYGVMGGLILGVIALARAYYDMRRKERRERLRQDSLERVFDGTESSEDVADVLSHAAELEREGNWMDALILYENVAESLKGKPNADYAINCAERVRERLKGTKEGERS